MRDYLKPIKGRVFVYCQLGPSDRAFSSSNPLWDTDGDREGAKLWCETIGTTLLSNGRDDKKARDALGWKGTEALISFHHNTPNNTLPIFWFDGSKAAVNWAPLFRRD